MAEIERDWYILQTYTGHEQKVQKNLEKLREAEGFEDAIFDIRVPIMESYEMKDGKKRVLKKKLFPGYVLIELRKLVDDELSKNIIRKIRLIPGVGNFLNIDSDTQIPKPLSKKEKKDLFDQIGEIQSKDTLKPKFDFVVGEHIKVIDGPFINFTGVIESIDEERAKATVTVEIFGRATPIELDFLQIGKM